jgi:uncharacterized protein YndB with AHSA1/START domain
MILRARVAVPLKRVHEALTDAEALRAWLAEHAEVDLPHRFAFWGRYTPEGDAPHQHLLHADDRTLRFSWLLDGAETTTEITLSEEGNDSTIITVSQTHFDFQEAISGDGVRGALQTFWCLSIANLVDHLEGRELTPKCDFTVTGMRGQTLIDASPGEVFDSLVDSGKATRWFGTPMEIEPRVGGHWSMIDHGGAEIIALEPGRGLSTDWGSVGVHTWELEESDGGTRLTFVQSGFDEQRPPYAAWLGWLSGVAELRRFHELSDWRPIWFSGDAPAAVEGV